MEELLTTKFFTPPTMPHHIKRKALVERLKRGMHKKLTLVSAPAGFGKSMLISEWLSDLKINLQNEKNAEIAISWISLEKTENDTALFLAYLVSSLSKSQGIPSSFGKCILEIIGLPQLPVREILTSLINEIASSHGKILIVIDDFHVIDVPDIHGIIQFLIEHSPPQLHIVIATRDDPPLPLAQLHAQGQISEFRASDLRFSPSDFESFFHTLEGISLSPEEISTLEAQTEGWVAGMQLAAVSLQSKSYPPHSGKLLNGSNSLMFDYLVTEVLDRQPEKVKQFLLQTSVLYRFTGNLCNFLTGDENNHEILAQLIQMNLFIVPLDDEGHWYRYHHLFSEFLRMKLYHSDRSRIAALLVKASLWFEENHYYDEAMDCSLQASDYIRAVQLFLNYTNEMMKAGTNYAIWRLIDQIPGDIVLSVPDLSIFKAWGLLTSGQLESAEEHLQAALQCATSNEEDADSRIPPERKNLIIGRIAAIQAYLDSYKGDIAGTIRNAKEALRYLRSSEMTTRSLASLALGDAYSLSGNLSLANTARMDALEESKASGNIYLLLANSVKLAITRRMEGRLGAVLDICHKYYQLAEKERIVQLDVVGWLISIWGEALAETGGLDEALRKCRSAVQTTSQSEDVAMIGWARVSLSRVLFLRGEFEESSKNLEEWEEITWGRKIPPHIAESITAWQIRLLLAQNRMEDAIEKCARCGLSPEGHPSHVKETEYSVFARVLIAQTDYSGSLGLLKGLFDSAESGGRVSGMIEIMILQAISYWALEDRDRVRLIIRRLIPMAEKGGFFQIFMSEGSLMQRILLDSAESGFSTPLVRRLLAAFSEIGLGPPIHANPVKESAPLIEPLSEREMDVLSLLAEGLSRRQMAEKLFVSPHTIKSHLRKIYSKLGVQNQIQAVNRAQHLGILDTER